MTDGPTHRIARLDAAAIRRRTRCGEGTMVWREWGKGASLVLLHGGFGSWLHWVRNVEPLARSFRVIAADLPGLGESAMPAEPVSPRSLGEIVAGGLDEIIGPSGRAHLVGFSFGGLVAGQVAERLGDRILTLTLVGASGLGVSRPPLELVRRTVEMNEAARAAAQRENLRRLMFHDERRIDPLALHVHATNDARARLRSRRLSLGDSLRVALSRLDVPLHGIWGSRDATAGEFLAERETVLRAAQPGARFRAIDDAGHWVQYEAHDAFEQTLRAWLGRVARC